VKSNQGFILSTYSAHRDQRLNGEKKRIIDIDWHINYLCLTLINGIVLMFLKQLLQSKQRDRKHPQESVYYQNKMTISFMVVILNLWNPLISLHFLLLVPLNFSWKGLSLHNKVPSSETFLSEHAIKCEEENITQCNDNHQLHHSFSGSHSSESFNRRCRPALHLFHRISTWHKSDRPSRGFCGWQLIDKFFEQMPTHLSGLLKSKH